MIQQIFIMTDKEKILKLEKKLEQRKLTIYEAIQEQVVLDWLKTGNPAFLSMLTPQSTIQIINLLIIPGPPNDKIRSFKIPMIATQLLSTMIPKIYELLFTEDPEEKGAPVFNRLLKYFDGPSNYVLSGYIVKIIMNLFPANPARVLEQLFRSKPERMLNFIESHSIAELLTRIIIVQDALLNIQIKERVTLFGEIVGLYIENKRSEDELANINWLLGEAITRLWTLKHKQLGRFSGMIFRLVEAVIDYNNLYQQESMIIAVCKQVSVYQKEAPYLIAALYKKIQQELALAKSESTNSSKGKLTTKRYKYLQALFYIIAHGSEAISKQLSTANVFTTIIDFILRYQWHSLALVEIEKIIRAAIHSQTQAIFLALSRSHLTERLKELAKIHFSQSKTGCGFSGLLLNIANILRESLNTGSGYGGWLKKSQLQGELDAWLTDFLNKKKGIEEKIRVVHQIAKPVYSITRLPDLFRQFFQQTEAINARMQSESPSKHQVEQKEVLEEIQNQNELVYKLMSQLVAETVPEDKKPEQALE